MPETPRSLITPAVEDFLKAVYETARAAGGDPAGTTALADVLRIAPPSVTSMAKKLAEAGLINHVPYRGVTLTEAGRLIAVETIRHHRLVETYLHQALGVPWDRVHDEAERWEHVLSEDVEARMDAALGFPTHDPHGAPIPTPALEHAAPATAVLADLPLGAAARVAEVDDGDADLLRYVGALGLYPGTAFEVVEAAPYAGGPVRVRLEAEGGAGAEQTVGDRAARAIRVDAGEG